MSIGAAPSAARLAFSSETNASISSAVVERLAAGVVEGFGVPNATMTPSPMMLTTVPPRAWTSATTRSK